MFCIARMKGLLKAYIYSWSSNNAVLYINTLVHAYLYCLINLPPYQIIITRLKTLKNKKIQGSRAAKCRETIYGPVRGRWFGAMTWSWAGKSIPVGRLPYLKPALVGVWNFMKPQVAKSLLLVWCSLDYRTHPNYGVQWNLP